MRFEGQTALVTGGSRGIGAEIVRLLAGEGADTYLNFRSSTEQAEQVRDGLSGVPGNVRLARFDVSDYEAVEEGIGEILDEAGGIDLLVNNAGARFDNLLMRMSPEEWERAIAVNLGGAFNVCRNTIRAMAEQRSGAIVNVASVAGVVGSAGQSNYAAAKGGLISFTKSIAEEYGSRGIRANAVVPGLIDTGMTDELPDKKREEYLSQIPLDRFGEPEEVAETVAFLLSDAASYITGTAVHINGGGARV